MQSSVHAPQSSAPWQLAKGCAVTFYPEVSGVLRVSSGRAWATFNPSPWSPAARWNPADDAGDFFVMPGMNLPLRAGEGVVIESWPAGDATSSTVVWEPAPVSAAATRWQQAVVLPVRELGQGLAQVVRAFGRLLVGLAGYREFLVAGRGKVQTCLESNAP